MVGTWTFQTQTSFFFGGECSAKNTRGAAFAVFRGLARVVYVYRVELGTKIYERGPVFIAGFEFSDLTYRRTSIDGTVQCINRSISVDIPL